MVRFIQAKRGSPKKHRAEPAHPLLHTTLQAEVEDLGGEGQGIITHPQGLKLFVPGVWPGETVEIKITQIKNRVGFARLLNIVTPAPGRIATESLPCRYHGFGLQQCGGCSWLFMAYAAQTAAKQARIESLFSGLISPENMLPILTCEQPLNYRTRAQLKSDGQSLGFVSAGSNTLVDIEQCVVLTEHNQKMLGKLRAQLPNRDWQPRKKQQWTTLDIDHEHSEASVNQRLPFAQANAAQNTIMQQWLAGQIQPLDKTAPVLELFAGSGNFTRPLVNAGFTDVTAVEVVSEALATLQQDLPTVQTHACDLFDEAAVTDFSRKVKDSRYLLLDPPRDGFKWIDRLLKPLRQLETVLYISCDPATFKRDVQTLAECGFVLEQLQPLDLFPQTPHVEILARLQRVKKVRRQP